MPSPRRFDRVGVNHGSGVPVSIEDPGAGGGRQSSVFICCERWLLFGCDVATWWESRLLSSGLLFPTFLLVVFLDDYGEIRVLLAGLPSGVCPPDIRYSVDAAISRRIGHSFSFVQCFRGPTVFLV